MVISLISMVVSLVFMEVVCGDSFVFMDGGWRRSA